MVKLIVTPARISYATRLDFTLVSSAIFGYILGRNAALELRFLGQLSAKKEKIFFGKLL